MTPRCLAMLLLVFGGGFGASEQAVRQGDDDAVRAVEKQFNTARAHADVAALDRLLADGWTITHGDGTMDSKAKYLADLRSGARKFDYVEDGQLSVRVYHDTAVVSGTSDSKVQYNGQPSGGALRFTRVYIRQGSSWLMIVSHATRRQS